MVGARTTRNLGGASHIIDPEASITPAQELVDRGIENPRPRRLASLSLGSMGLKRGHEFLTGMNTV